MTDASALPVKAINGSDLSHAALASTYSAPPLNGHFHAPVHVENVEDESISCICGFADDDGYTVACDNCNRWQHQSCYYPQYDDKTLPSDLAHFCVDCHHRELDVGRARLRQQEKRGHSETLSNGIKRTAPKSHKKKVKESTSAYTNGWPLDKVRHDRNSASPRDQPPPAKRPKTAHRTSDSTTGTTTTTTIKGHSRKRNASNVNARRSSSRSPDSPSEKYSEEFLRCYQDDDWTVTDANLHNSIAVTNSLTNWLHLNDEEFRDEHSSAKGEVLQRWDGSLDDIPGKAEIEVVERQDTSVMYEGQHPTWKGVTVIEPVADGGYIDELKGHVGFKKDYQHEDANRWSQLRHPEPFVFFHPKLPLVIDARHEGTAMRYVRRSCKPNARLQILITNSKDYHFCFMATQQIEPGEEVAVGWDTADGLPELASKNGLTGDELEMLARWVSTALANCGPCACLSSDSDCSMLRLDRRARDSESKVPKSKKRKTGQHISPLNTQVNSRSGSEARRVDQDDDGTDSRSASGSAGRGSASRDMTPNTHYSTNGVSSAIPELSERERKKLAKEEEIFRRQEEEQGKQAKKKRNSAGSSLSTPSATTSKQLGFPQNHTSKYVDSGTSKQSGLPSKGVPGRKPKMPKATPKPVSRVVRRAKPVYVDAATQCDMDEEEAAKRPPIVHVRIPYISNQKRLLELCARNNRAIAEKRRLRAAMPQPAQTNAQPHEKAVEDEPPSPAPAIVSSPAHQDVEMQDAPADEDGPQSSTDPNAKAVSDDAVEESKSAASVEHPDPPWSSKVSAESDAPQKPANMHLQMPPPPTNPFAAPPGPSATSPNSAVVQSPASVAPLFSPAVQASVAASPARKKLSLSDYTRRKAKTQDHEPKTDRESSPASTASGPIVPPLQPSSSAEAHAAEGGSAIDEDVKMEDVTPEPPRI